MATPREREETSGLEKEFDLASFFQSYMAGIEASKANAAAQINASYDKLTDAAGLQKVQIDQNADRSFRDIYANAKASAINQNEQLAAMGLAKGTADAPSSGYSETSRVRADNAMRENLSRTAQARDGNLAAVDLQIGQINAERAKELSEMEREYSNQLFGAMNALMQTEFDYYVWQKEFDDKQQSDEADAAREAQELAYQKELDAYRREQEAKEYDYRREQDLLEQKRWEAEFDHQKAQDALKQSNFLSEYALKKADQSKREEEKEQAQSKDRVRIPSAKELEEAAKEERFQRYLSFARSSASFPTTEAYASYFDQLYRQQDISEEQYRRALTSRGIPGNVIKVRLGLL